MIYILNPGDGHDVVTFTDTPQVAINALRAVQVVARNFAALYSYAAGTFRQYTDGNWYVVEKSNLPLKVLAVDRGPRPAMLKERTER